MEHAGIHAGSRTGEPAWAVRPAYGEYCFAGIPHTVAEILGARTGPGLPAGVVPHADRDAEIVLVVLLDGLGLAQWQRDRRDQPFLDRLTERSRITPLTSVYPSETAAALTTFHTGVLPATHGVIGWNVFEPTVDQAFEALPFRTKAGTEPTGLDRDAVADADPIYPALRTHGIDDRHVVPADITPTGERVHPYTDLAGFPAELVAALAAAEPPAYVYAYLPQIDTVSHRVGTATEAYRSVVSAVLGRVEEAIAAVPRATADETLLVVTADHGHVDTDPSRNVDLSAFDVVMDNLSRHADGTPVRFAGSARNVHLHLEPGSAPRVRDELTEALDALVLTREEVLAQELFGPDPSTTFRRRLGDVVITHRDLGVWWGDAEPSTLAHVGMHGGLHPDEMLVPFAAVGLADLRG